MENWENLTIGQRILAIRGKEPRHSFAKKLEIGTATLQRYENDERKPDTRFLENLQKLTDYSLDYLLYGKERGVVIGSAIADLPKIGSAIAGLSSSNQLVAETLEEQILLTRFRNADPQTRAFILKGLE